MHIYICIYVIIVYLSSGSVCTCLLAKLASLVLVRCKYADNFSHRQTYNKQRLVRREQPRDSAIVSEEKIIPRSPPVSAVMSCEEGCLPSQLRHPLAQASRNSK